MTPASPEAAGAADVPRLAALIRREFLHRPFGDLRVWGHAVFRPGDLAFEVTDAVADGPRLVLTLAVSGGIGQPFALTVSSPGRLVLGSGGLSIDRAAHLAVAGCEARSDGPDRVRLRTAAGEGDVAAGGRLALELRP
jgi:hypothetical protein